MVERQDGRRARSQRSREQVVAAATELFIERGYVAATIGQVAERAGVAAQTVYHLFGSKPKLLAAVLDTTIAGDHAEVAVTERPWVAALADAPDADVALTMLVEAASEIIARVAPVFDVLQRAAADPEVAELLGAIRRGRRSDQRSLVDALARAGHLRDGLDVNRAADAVYALLSEEVHLLLVRDCGWTIDRYQGWVLTMLRADLF